MNENLNKAKAFAECLDQDDFAAAKNFLASNCFYKFGAKFFRDLDKIMDSYRENSNYAQKTFDKVEYESSVTQIEPNQCEVVYTDIISKNMKSHTYKCKQVLKFDEEGKISEIVHEELPGERDRLYVYYKEIGLR